MSDSRYFSFISSIFPRLRVSPSSGTTKNEQYLHLCAQKGMWMYNESIGKTCWRVKAIDDQSYDNNSYDFLYYRDRFSYQVSLQKNCLKPYSEMYYSNSNNLLKICKVLKRQLDNCK